MNSNWKSTPGKGSCFREHPEGTKGQCVRYENVGENRKFAQGSYVDLGKQGSGTVREPCLDRIWPQNVHCHHCSSIVNDLSIGW